MSPSGYGADNDRWFRPFGTLDDGEFQVAVTPTATNPVEGWRHTTLRVAWLGENGHVEHDTGDEELVVVPLSGSVTIEVSGGDPISLDGRASVFEGPSDTAYLPRQRTITVRNSGTGPARVALCGARASTDREPRRIAPDEAVPEARGAGNASREVRAFGLPPVLDADAILVCEVITPAGNWSSWPPHKHDEDRPGVESELEEIYYFETRSTDARGTDPVGYQRVYGTGERPIDVLAEVRSGDVVLVPHGWHGPAMAAPDADLYYLNVMAGPGTERAWLITDDPAHAWVRETWTETTHGSADD
ncbi:5-deoxyglucuronate isomerase [Knoellia flava TL1]|uniref:5-deoxy-glucuronate isomerase n=2 Tax=Knoellia flava TaxID=913969 RepID=A0A8H9KTL1_9MICO|nr:5-deoxy-glucuronate isomerase [Knoellia flava]KGN32708.1 5-deoxyglucuronate isomerase [Knoellia flava TL1]GGB87427.1 5-deoxy-glucuronate isomerase [Knoellia flava]